LLAAISARSGTDEAPEREALYAEFIVEASKAVCGSL
jgi:hypothetical protein